MGMYYKWLLLNAGTASQKGGVQTRIGCKRKGSMTAAGQVIQQFLLGNGEKDALATPDPAHLRPEIETSVSTGRG